MWKNARALCHPQDKTVPGNEFPNSADALGHSLPGTFFLPKEHLAMPRYLFVTGRLAAQSLREILQRMPSDFESQVAVLPISVAALMDARFIARHLTDSMNCDRVIVPGLCTGDLNPISKSLHAEVIRGPKSLKDIPEFFGMPRGPENYGCRRLQILAEIADAYRIGPEEILARAGYFKSSGADIIDLGCPVEGGFPEIGSAVALLKKAGFVVSVDSFHPDDILKADRAGVDLLLSVNSGNLDLARRLRCKVVVIPDFDKGLESLVRSIDRLEAWGIPYIIDPVLRPISFGFAESIGNFIEIRRRYPDAAMLMGLGNITELTGADSTGITAVMAGILAELRIDYALTTEVISWARGAVRELDLASRLMHYALEKKLLPKHLDEGLLTIKDPPFKSFREDELRAMQKKVRDRNFRIFAGPECIYVFNNKVFVKGAEIQAIFDQLGEVAGGQAFYLGRELQKASLALQLGKKYVQEQDLRWGYLSNP
jgi:dihydropteroate synthase